MRAIKALVVGSTILATLALPAIGGAAVGYDLTNPSSTSCVNRGLVDVAGSARTFGVFTVKLRRSSGCNTAWAVVTRTDTKRCLQSGLNCAKVRITRTLDTGTKTATPWRKMTDGTRGTFSFQLNGIVGARYVGTAAKFSGTKIGDSATLTLNANGTWTVS